MNIVETGLAFAEGLALIASPCILPVLPLVLSASVAGGRKRPFGIIIGFVLSFTLFALASRKLVSAFHIDLDVIKNISLVLLSLFGLVLLSDRLSEKFASATQGAANLGSNLAAGGKDGLMSGMLIGALIGLIWTPCAGPILAAVLVQVIRQQSDGAGSIIIAAFALGAGIPMLIIALMGRKIMNRLSFFTVYADKVRKIFGVIIILSVAFIASGVDAQTFFSRSSTSTQSEEKHLLATPYPAPEFSGIEAWINSKPLTMKELKGKVVLIDFWTYSCINCVRTLPHITSWDEKYRDKGLVIIGVSAPEFEFEKNLANVKAAVESHGIKYPVALDNNLATWSNYNNQYWPAHYLIDRSGKVVYTHFGEGNYDITENVIRELLGLNDKAQSTEIAPQYVVDQTHETYLGYARMSNFSNKQTVLQDATSYYQFPDFLPLHHWSLQGKWKIESQKITSAEPNAVLRLNFKAKKVFLVLGTATGRPLTVALRVNGEKTAKQIVVNTHTLYELVSLKEAANSQLDIEASAPGLEAYAFTFGG